MTFGVEALGTVPFGYVENAGVPSRLMATTASLSGVVFIIEFTAKKIGADTDEVIFRYSTTGYVSPNVTGADTDNVYFDGRVKSPLQLSRTIPVAPEASRRIAQNIGTIELVNSDRAFDSFLRAYAIDGRRIWVKAGLDSFKYSEFTTVFAGSIVSASSDAQTLQITVRDNGYKLDRPLQTNFYGGTGGADGTSQIANSPKPICLQFVFNETPVFIDPAHLVYQIHDGAIHSVETVRDSGVPLTFSADYANYAALTAASLTTGHYATCLALGMFRLGGQPLGGVTFDAVGAVYSSSLNPSADACLSLLKTFGGVDDSEINIGSWEQIEGGDIWGATDPIDTTLWAGKFFGNQSITLAEALDDYLSSIFYYWGCDVDGRLIAGQLSAADETTVSVYYDESDIKNLEVLDPLDGTYPPRWRQRLGFNRNGTVQSPTELAGAVGPSDVQTFGLPYLVQEKSLSTVKDDFLNAMDPPVLVSPYRNATGEQLSGYPPSILLEKITDLFSELTTAVRIGTGRDVFNRRLGESITINHPRIRKGQDWTARIIDIDVDEANNKYDLVLFGNIPAPDGDDDEAPPDGGGGPVP